MSKKFNEFSEEEKQEMLALHNEGVLNKELSELFKTSTTMVSRLLRSMGIESKHPMLTDERKRQIVECYKECQNMKKVSQIMKCDSKTVSKLLEEFGIQKLTMAQVRRKYDIDEDYFESIDTPNKAYALGMIFADGTVSKNHYYITITLQSRDKPLLDLLNAEFGGNRKLSLVEYNKKNSKWQDQYVLSVASKKMHDDLMLHGAIPNKSLVLNFPNDIPNELICHFIRGYYDGDGSLSKNEDRCTLISTDTFCQSLKNIVKEQLDINASVMFCHNQKDKPTRTFQIAGKRQVKKFLDWIYQDAEIYLERKHSLYLSKYYSNTNDSLQN